MTSSLTPIPFSSDSSASSQQAKQIDIVNHPTDLPSITDILSLEIYFSIADTRAFITRHRAHQVGLQLPDHLLHYASTLSSLISASSRCVCYVLADTSFSPCCVDTIAAQHVRADVLIHYGTACLSPINKTSTALPVYYVFGRATINIPHLINLITEYAFLSIDDKEEKKQNIPQQQDAIEYIVIVYDLEYEYAMNEMKELVAEYNDQEPPGNRRKWFIVSQVNKTTDDDHDDGKTNTNTTSINDLSPSATVQQFHLCGHSWSLPQSASISSAAATTTPAYQLLFLGKESSPFLLTLLLTYNTYNCHIYDPSSSSNIISIQSTATSSTISRLLTRRFYLMNTALSARIFGLLLGTLSIESTLSTLSRCQSLITSYHKTSYTIVVGKINESKLANFNEIDVFVLLACPYSVLIDSRHYHRPIITVFELEMALTGKAWTGKYQLDMTTHIVQHQEERGKRADHSTTDANNNDIGHDSHKDIDATYCAEDAYANDIPRFDPVTGKLIAAVSSASNNNNDRTIITSTIGTLSVSRPIAAVDLLANRSWVGLSTKGQRLASCEYTERSVLEEGLEGIASGYNKELHR